MKHDFKGTKGKWEVVDNGYFLDIKKVGETGDIASCIFVATEWEKAVNSIQQNKANANLIAAAPEMLEALMKIKWGDMPVDIESVINKALGL